MLRTAIVLTSASRPQAVFQRRTTMQASCEAQLQEHVAGVSAELAAEQGRAKGLEAESGGSRPRSRTRHAHPGSPGPQRVASRSPRRSVRQGRGPWCRRPEAREQKAAMEALLAQVQAEGAQAEAAATAARERISAWAEAARLAAERRARTEDR